MYNNTDRILEKNAHRLKGTLYDLGAGESPYTDFFLSNADVYVAVEWAASIHDTSADIVANLNEALPIEDAVADSVICLSVLEHLSEPQTMLNEAFRIMKPGAEIVLQVPWQWRIHEAPYDFFRYTPFGLKHLFNKAGFDDIVIEAQDGYFTTMTMKWNYFSRRILRGPKILRQIITLPLSITWFTFQVLAPILDKLDKRWESETTGYFVTARKAEL